MHLAPLPPQCGTRTMQTRSVHTTIFAQPVHTIACRQHVCRFAGVKHIGEHQSLSERGLIIARHHRAHNTQIVELYIASIFQIFGFSSGGTPQV